jgi:hypothetical protein
MTRLLAVELVAPAWKGTYCAASPTKGDAKGLPSEDGVGMTVLSHAETDQEVLYDIALQRRLPDSVRSQFSPMSVETTGPQTVLRAEPGGPAQLDALLQRLRSVGVVLTGIHRMDEPDPEHPDRGSYEVRVAGELGESLLHYLRWAHYVVPEQTHVRLSVGPAGLRRFLRACTSCGASIERVRRVEPVEMPPTRSRERAEQTRSRSAR